MNKVGSIIASGLICALTGFLPFAAGVAATEEAANPQPTGSRAAQALAGDPALISQVRALGELQQRAAHGDKAALSEQLSLARTIAQELGRKPASA